MMMTGKYFGSLSLKRGVHLNVSVRSVFDAGSGVDPPQEVAAPPPPQKVLHNLFGGVDSNPLKTPIPFSG